ncbi:GMC family oxidoreductase [Dactylosporangium sp. CA-092794]|uniref:GMC family oxidoreductase n=1 Tax=Dactylosporangium sp. CA-092794 TaxID=3239929 RepID=UPI003D8DB950
MGVPDEEDLDLRGFDFIVVGAGSAGSVIARRLLDSTDARMLVLEAGGAQDDAASIVNPPQWVENLGSRYDWNYQYAPAPHTGNRTIPLARGKVVGGSGSINALVWARGNRADYDGWAAAGNPGWEYESVLPLFQQAEDWEDGANEYRGAGGPIRVERAKDLHPVAQALIDSGLSYGMPYLDDMNVPDPLGVGPVSMNVRDGQRCSSWRGYLKPVADHPRLTLLTGAHVHRLTFAGSRCTGVEFERAGRGYRAGAASEVVLAAGAIDTPRLLLRSGVGPAGDLRRLGIDVVGDLAGVGQNLQDHPILAGLCFEAEEALPAFNNNLEGSTFFWKSRSDLPVADLMFVSVQIPYVSPEIAQEFPPPPNSFVIAPGLMRVESRGQIRLLGAGADAPVEIQPNFLAERQDVDALLAGIELGLDIASQPAYRKIIRNWVAPSRPMTRDQAVSFLRKSCLTYFHSAGTCAMGPGPEAVVDARLRVHGVEGLRVADASVMPSITSANTYAPSVLIGEAAARFLAARPPAGSST